MSGFRSKRLELRLIVEAQAGSRTDLVLEAQPETTAGAVAATISRTLGQDPDSQLIFKRSGAVLLPEATLSELGVLDGDYLLLATSEPLPLASEDEPSRFECAILGGPSAGRRFPLRKSTSVLGRDGDCDVPLDDPTLSGKHLRIELSGDSIAIVDDASRNGTAVEGVRLAAGETHALRRGELIQAGRTIFAIEKPVGPLGASDQSPNGVLAFNRPPRISRPKAPYQFRIPAPPDDPQRARLPLAASIVPVVLGLTLYLVTGSPMMLMFTAFTPLMAISSFIESRRSGKAGFKKARNEFRKRLIDLKAGLDEAHAGETDRRRVDAPSMDDLAHRVEHRQPNLWERRPDDRDYLRLRVGAARLRSDVSVECPDTGNAELVDEAKQIAAWYGVLPPVPVIADVADLGVVGICGDRASAVSLLRSLILQAAVLHSPRDLAICAGIGREALENWAWLKWLPHVRSDEAALQTQLGSGKIETLAIVENLADLLNQRQEQAEGQSGHQRPSPDVLLLLDEVVAPERATLAGLLEHGREFGIYVFWLGQNCRDLPGAVRGLIELDRSVARLSFTDARTGEVVDDVIAEGLDTRIAERVALALTPLRDVSGTSASRVPRAIALLDLFGEETPTCDWVAHHWGKPAKGLQFTLGCSAEGPFLLDLRDDGPHALVSGTTGAGKSELLQTLVASLAVSYPPTRLNFLLIDYKGGAAFKECIELPHTVGFVTDLDEHLAQRALASLNAELRRRETALREYDAKDLLELERVDPGHAPASLVIVIDEFATLAKEVPDFVQGVVDVAQRGRSLGVHLILATQRPGGVVSENIRANTNLRVALRVNNTGESSDVIGVPDAARIPRTRPGRAYARMGHSDLIEFQTAYVGGVTQSATEAANVVVREFTFGPVELQRRESSRVNDVPTETDLELLVRLAGAAADSLALPESAKPWLPPLNAVIPLADLPRIGKPADDRAIAILGLIDEPSTQRQTPFIVDLESEGSLLVYGASGAGKTVLLRTIAASLALRLAPEDLHIYGLDFATRGLSVLERLPHCGSVIPGNDEDRVGRLFSMLRRQLNVRKERFEQTKVFTLADYARARPDDRLARILVLLDGYSGFASAFERMDQGALISELPRLVADGRPLGIHFAITSDRRGAIPNALAGIIPARVVLRMADIDEYMALGLSSKTVKGAKLPPGRGFTKEGLELQIALIGSDPSGEGQTRAFSQLAEALAKKAKGGQAPAVLPMPTQVDRALLPKAHAPLHAVLAVGDSELKPIEINLSERHFLISGPYRSGRSTALSVIAESLRTAGGEIDLWLLAPRRSPLSALDLWTESFSGVAACENAVSRLVERVDSDANEGGRSLVIVVDDADELADGAISSALERMVRRGRDRGVRFVAAAERQALQRAFSGWLRELRKEEYGLLLDPELDQDGDLLGVRLPRRTNPIFPPGRGYLVERGRLELVQVAS